MCSAKNLIDEYGLAVRLTTEFCLLRDGLFESHFEDPVEYPIDFQINGFIDEEANCPDKFVISLDGSLFAADCVFEAAEEKKGLYAEMASVICKEDGTVEDKYLFDYFNSTATHGFVCFLNEMRVEKGFRGNRVSSLLLLNIQEILNTYLRQDIVAIFAYVGPFEIQDEEDRTRMRSRLMNYYKSLGFRAIDNSNVIWLPLKQ